MSNKKKKKSKETKKPETGKCPKRETIKDTEKEKCIVCHEGAEEEQQENKAEQQPSEIEQLATETEQPPTETEQPSTEAEQQSAEVEQQPSETEQKEDKTEQQPDETEQQANEKNQESKKEEPPEKGSNEKKPEPSMLKTAFVLGVAALIIFIIVIIIVTGRGSNDELNVEEEVEVTEEVDETEELVQEPSEEEDETPEGVLSNDYVVILQYRGLELTGIGMPEITDDDVEFMIQSELATQSTTNEVTDRPAENGDTVTIDFAGSVDGEYFDGGTSEGFDLTLGAGMFIGPYGEYEGFEEQIIGHSIGDNFDIQVQFPSAYHSPDLAGEVANFNITIHAITETITPELTDEWVQENSTESTTVEEYRQKVKEELYEATKLNILFMRQHEVFDALMEQVVIIETPQWAIEEEVMKLKALFQNLAAMQGITLEEYLLTFMNMDEETFNQEVLIAAEETAPRTLAINLILENENIEPTQEEMMNRMEVLARLSGMESAEEFIESFGEGYAHETMILLSVTEFLIEHSIAAD